MTADDHGRISTYGNYRCRCLDCRTAWAEYTSQRRAARKRATRLFGLPAAVAHGGSAYINWGCRCDVCRDAHSDNHARWVRSRAD